MLEEAFDKTGDDIKDMICTLTDGELENKFYGGFGTAHGREFTAWGAKYVYFPVVYDGAEWVGWAPRNPCDEATPHRGGQ